MTTSTFQEIIRKLSHYWEEQGCIINQGYDLEVGAGTFNPSTFLRCLGPEPYNSAYVEACRRPTDGRYGKNPNRVQHFFQYQVVMKPVPHDFQDLYLKSLEAIGIDLSQHDIRFVHDDWESPTLGAWGLGWEVWMDGMEVTQFTYFQSAGGIPLSPITGEVTYGLERLAMYILGKNSLFDLPWNDQITYGDLYQRNEVEWSHYNFEEASTEMWFRHFDDYEKEAKRLMDKELPIPAYDFVIKASHAFNLLDARGVISVTERMAYILRIRNLSKSIAQCWVANREALGYPLLVSSPPSPAPSLPPPEKGCAHPDEAEDFIFEIGTEELPAILVPLGLRNLKKAMETLLKELGLSYQSLEVFGTPRRLALFVSQLAKGKREQKIEKKGPPVNRAYDEAGKPLPAAQGFFRSLKIEAPNLEEIRSGQIEGVQLQSLKGAEYLFATLTEPGQATESLLAQSLEALVLGLDWPKSMRWGDLDIHFPRPIRWILALHGEKVIPLSIGPVVASNTSQGHRQLAPETFTLSSASQYVEALEERKVQVKCAHREQSIRSQIAQIEKELQVTIGAQEKVIPQVLYLCEWPQLTHQTFDKAYLSVPKEVLISEMVEHQKYFPVLDESQNLKNLFIITADNTPSDPIREGNGKVLSARLSDGAFLYEQDLKVSLESFNEKLKQVTYLKGMGSLNEKVHRLIKQVETLHGSCPQASLPQAKRIAELCKADLATEMVYEFPELQGTMGMYYAQASGEPPTVARGILEHWMPKGEKAPLPQSWEGTLVALADKMDGLIACIGAGHLPSSSSDPHGLRRHVLGIIKILITNQIHLDLPSTLKRCAKTFPQELLTDGESVCQEILSFVTNRIRTVFQEYGFSRDETEASLAKGWRDIYASYLKVEALHAFRKENDAFPKLLEVFKRAKGQLANAPEQLLSPDLLQEPAEKVLFQALQELQPQFESAIKAFQYKEAYSLIASMQPLLANLFDSVRILAEEEEIRNNRIGLLQKVFALFEVLVDFEKVQR